MTKDTQIVYSAKLARELLKQRYQIVDIEPNRTNPERTVYFFLNENGLIDLINQYSNTEKLGK